MGFMSYRAELLLRKVAQRLPDFSARKLRTPAQFRARYFADVPVDLSALKYCRAEHLPESGPVPWLDRDDAEEQIQRRIDSGALSEEQALDCRTFSRDGYVIFERLFPESLLDRCWNAYEAAIARGRIKLRADAARAGDSLPGRHLNTHEPVPELREMLAYRPLLQRLEMLIGRPPIPYQTITSHKGSQQRAHSDAIHMTTYPNGYLTAAWIAFEDIHADSGPLFYYPGTQRLPYVFCHHLGMAPGEFEKIGYDAVIAKHYEPKIQAQLKAGRFPRKTLLARKGDVLVWHNNLIHGGARRRDLALTRKALVCHYYTRGAVCYHDLSGYRERL